MKITVLCVCSLVEF